MGDTKFLIGNPVNNLQNMNYFINGITGFFGSSLASWLGIDGHKVLGLDNLSKNSSSSPLSNTLFPNGDVNALPSLWTLLQNVDCVFHLAARVLVLESIKDTLEYNCVYVNSTVTLMEVARHTGVKRIVLISSGAISWRLERTYLWSWRLYQFWVLYTSGIQGELVNQECFTNYGSWTLLWWNGNRQGWSGNDGVVGTNQW